jgi:murein tripeptide amidase MpaA
LEILITPMQNPDGYEYSRNHERYWRKNRRRNSDGTFGVDLNRNWDDHWGQFMSSSNPDDDNYMGLFPMSEPEVYLIADWILSVPNRYIGIDFHAS